MSKGLEERWRDLLVKTSRELTRSEHK